MMRNVFIFLATFAIGALAAFTIRAARHEPYSTVTELAVKDGAPMVDPKPLSGANAPKPAEVPAAMPAHGGSHTSAPPSFPPSSYTGPTPDNKPVNTVCAICGMKVDPAVPTLEYQGKKIGFGCKMCPPKFKADPDKYGPFYLRNEVIKR